jgi:hypothetical protein
MNDDDTQRLITDAVALDALSDALASARRHGESELHAQEPEW